MAQQGYDQHYNGQQYGYPMPQPYPPAQGPPQYMGPPGQIPPGAMQSNYAMVYGYGQQPPGPYPQGPMQYPPAGGYNPQPIVNQPMGDEEYDDLMEPQIAIVSQPGGWMNMPQAPLNCPGGLEYLTMVDQILVHQQIELLEVLTGFETENKYLIKNSMGQNVYFAVEESDCCSRNCFGPVRPFEMKILDNYQREVMHLSRPLACQGCCCFCCLQRMEVFAPIGMLIGTIEQQWSIFKPSFVIRDVTDQVVLRIDGPFCTSSILCGDVIFKVKSADGQQEIGSISKQWSGLIREMYTDADNFGITFPIDLDVKMKAVLLGACFLIDFMYFETNSQNQ